MPQKPTHIIKAPLFSTLSKPPGAGGLIFDLGVAGTANERRDLLSYSWFICVKVPRVPHRIQALI